MIKERDIIKELRGLRGLTQEQLAEKAETTRLQIWRLENAQHNTSMYEFIRIIKALDFEVHLQVKSKIQDETGHFDDLIYF